MRRRHLTAFGLIALMALLAAPARGGTVTGKVIARPAKYTANAVVYIAKVADTAFKAPSEPAVMDQRNLTFLPHVLPVVAGTTVEFKNSDDVAHNVFSPDECAGEFNLGTWPPGQSKSRVFDKPGCVATILCIVHSNMEAYVVVLQNPYFAVTTSDGSFQIDDVPAGKYSLNIWSEKLSAEPVEITVPAKGVVQAGFALE